jgi:hypothetical protein
MMKELNQRARICSKALGNESKMRSKRKIRKRMKRKMKRRSRIDRPRRFESCSYSSSSSSSSS